MLVKSSGSVGVVGAVLGETKSQSPYGTPFLGHGTSRDDESTSVSQGRQERLTSGTVEVGKTQDISGAALCLVATGAQGALTFGEGRDRGRDGGRGAGESDEDG